MSVENIKKEMQAFQASIKNLSLGVSKASSLWKDEKYGELSTSISEIATQAKTVLVAGDKCCSSVDKFERIAGENY